MSSSLLIAAAFVTGAADFHSPRSMDLTSVNTVCFSSMKGTKDTSRSAADADALVAESIRVRMLQDIEQVASLSSRLLDTRDI
jgi:hypothetical protein